MDNPSPAVPPASFLGGLPPEPRRALVGALRQRTHPRGAVLLAEEEATRDLFVMLQGEAVATLFSHDGRAVQYREIGPGDIFGELSAIDGQPRSAFVVAKGPGLSGRLAADRLEALVEAEPALARGLLRFLAAQVRSLTGRVFEHTTLMVRERLVAEILRMARTAGAGEACAIGLPTHFELAARIGTHREAVTKELAALARDGLVARSGRTLEIPSTGRLAALLAHRDE